MVCYFQQYLGDSSRALDDFPTLNFALDLPDGLGQDDIIIFRSVYREHCEVSFIGFNSFKNRLNCV